MTNREFFSAIASIETLPAEIRAFAENSILKMDKANATRAAKPSKASTANIAAARVLMNMMELNRIYTAAEIAAMMDFKTEAGAANTSKATAVLKTLATIATVPPVVEDEDEEDDAE